MSHRIRSDSHPVNIQINLNMELGTSKAMYPQPPAPTLNPTRSNLLFPLWTNELPGKSHNRWIFTDLLAKSHDQGQCPSHEGLASDF